MVYLIEYDSLLRKKLLRIFNQLIINPTDSNASELLVSTRSMQIFCMYY